MPLCLSPNGTNTFILHEEPRELLVATVDGVVVANHSIDGWEVAGRRLSGRHIGSLLDVPTEHLLVAGAHTGGLFTSRDGGDTWRGSEAFADVNVYTLASRQLDTGPRLYAGTQPVGLFQSDDGGESWKDLPSIRQVPNAEKWTFPAPPYLGHLKNIAFHASSSQTIFVCVEQGGLFRSDDRGETWIELENITHSSDGAYKDVHRLVLRESDPRTMYFSGGDGLSVSHDAGQSWAKLTIGESRIGYPDALFINPFDSDVMYLAGARHDPSTWRHSHFADSTVMKSEDGGASWESIEKGLPAPLHGNIEAMSLYAIGSTIGLMIATTDGDVFASTDGGDSWREILSGLPPISKVGHYRLLQQP